MATPIRHIDRDTFLALADRAHCEAEAATLANVRARFLRAEAAWRTMALRAARSQQFQAEERARKSGHALIVVAGQTPSSSTKIQAP